MIWSTASTFEPTLRCVSITPLGRPVEPEVKMIVSRSSSRIFVSPSRRSSHATGASQAAAAARQLVAQRDLAQAVFQVDHLGVELQIEPLHDAAAGQHVADAALGDAVVHHLGGDACS